MIVIQHGTTDEVQIVATLDGISEEWAIVADPAPADFFTAPYLVEAGALVPDLATARAAQRAVINAARDAAQDGGADTPSGRFDTAGRSREFLNGAVTTAVLAQLNSQGFSINWTLADNSVVTLTGAELIAAGVAVALHVDAIHQRAVVLKDRIDAAETLAAITAIGWTLED